MAAKINKDFLRGFTEVDEAAQGRYFRDIRTDLLIGLLADLDNPKIHGDQLEPEYLNIEACIAFELLGRRKLIDTYFKAKRTRHRKRKDPDQLGLFG